MNNNLLNELIPIVFPTQMNTTRQIVDAVTQTTTTDVNVNTTVTNQNAKNLDAYQISQASTIQTKTTDNIVFIKKDMLHYLVRDLSANSIIRSLYADDQINLAERQQLNLCAVSNEKSLELLQLLSIKFYSYNKTQRQKLLDNLTIAFKVAGQDFLTNFLDYNAITTIPEIAEVNNFKSNEQQKANSKPTANVNFIKPGYLKALLRDVCVKSVVTILYSQNVISYNDKENIQSSRTKFQQAEKLFDLLTIKFNTADTISREHILSTLAESFKYSGQQYLVESLNFDANKVSKQPIENNEY